MPLRFPAEYADQLTSEDAEVPYLPDPDAIAAQCAGIRSKWSNRRHRRRAGIAEGVEVQKSSHGTGRVPSTVGRD